MAKLKDTLAFKQASAVLGKKEAKKQFKLMHKHLYKQIWEEKQKLPLMAMFNWEDTPQGRDYWYDIDSRYKTIEKEKEKEKTKVVDLSVLENKNILCHFTDSLQDINNTTGVVTSTTNSIISSCPYQQSGNVWCICTPVYGHWYSLSNFEGEIIPALWKAGFKLETKSNEELFTIIDVREGFKYPWEIEE